jgi:hypothetical protein
MPDPLLAPDPYPYIALKEWLTKLRRSGTREEQDRAIYITASGLMVVSLIVVSRMEQWKPTR